ncbi:hypothetical protein K6119_00735 [Paracrocinitomix mangrovi]|uniref:hypothetical protein n=1 Tax=Paracrocinitomix mangrovi TaxID=2862509 RepID=UPI001C8CFC50|nr:hypothetical protein [Paracrocinitomix mangrovi]UKN02039.1 hypothetical protein K6119_00735 [Paracrocinitomix mangrovi]
MKKITYVLIILLSFYSCRSEEDYDMSGNYHGTFYKKSYSGDVLDTSYFDCNVTDYGYGSIEIDTLPFWGNNIMLSVFEENLTIETDSIPFPAVSLGGAVWGTHHKVIEGQGVYNPSDHSIFLHYIIWNKLYTYGTNYYLGGDVQLNLF